MKTITSKVIKTLNLIENEDKDFIYKDIITIVYTKHKEDKTFSIYFKVNGLKSNHAFNDLSNKYLEKYSEINECRTKDFIQDVEEFYNEVIKLNESLVLTDEMIKEKQELVKTNVEILNSVIESFDYKSFILNVNCYKTFASNKICNVFEYLQDIQSLANKLNELLEDNSYDSLENTKGKVGYVDFYIRLFNEAKERVEMK